MICLLIPDLVASIVDSMSKDMLAHTPKIHTDDTIFPVLAKNKTHTGRLWVYIAVAAMRRQLLVIAIPKHEVAKSHRHFSKATVVICKPMPMQSDKCYASGNIIEVACWLMPGENSWAR